MVVVAADTAGTVVAAPVADFAGAAADARAAIAGATADSAVTAADARAALASATADTAVTMADVATSGAADYLASDLYRRACRVHRHRGLYVPCSARSGRRL